MRPPRKTESGSCKLFPVVIFFLATALMFHAAAGAGQAAVEAARDPILSASEIDYPPFCIVDPDGQAYGFSVELMRAALAAMERDVTFRTGHWNAVRDWLEKGEVQALPLVGRTPERELLFDFTFPYMSLHGAIVVRENDGNIRDLSDLKGRQAAVMKGDNAEEFLRREERGIEIHTTATFEEALQQLSSGSHDAVIIQRLVALRLIQEAGLANLRIVNRPIEGFRQDFCFAVKKGDSRTLALLNEGLALVMADGTYRHLHAKWFAALELPTNRRIVVGGDHNYPPYEYLDEKGRPTGFNVELTRAIAQETGLNVEIRLGPWAEILEALTRGEIDALQGMFYSPERDLKYDFTSPHTVNHCVSVVRKSDGPAPAALEALTGKRIVVQQGDIMHDFALENGLRDQVVAVVSQEDALRELAQGKHDCALVSRTTAIYWIEKYAWNNLSVGRQPFLSPEYCYAVPNNHKALLAQFSEGLNIIEKTGEYRRIYKKWLGVYADQSSDMAVLLRYVAMAAVPLVLFFLAFFLWSWSLRKQVGFRTKELHASERLLGSIIDAIAAPVFYKDARGVYLGCNRAFSELIGLPKESIIGKTVFDIAPADLAVIYHNADLDLIKAGDTQVYETAVMDNSGGQRQVIFHKALFRDPDGTVKGIVGAMLDITERKSAEDALRKRDAFIRTVLDNLPIGLAVNTLTEKTPTYMNKRFEEIYGWPTEELKDVETFFEKVYPDPAYRRKVRERILTDIESGDPERMQWDDIEVTGKDGSKRTVFAKNIPLYEQNVMISTVLDVSDHKQTLAALRESEDIFSKFMEHSPIYMFFKDDQLRALRLSANYESMLGKPMHELLGKSSEELFPSDLARSMAEDDKRILLEGKPVEVEEELDGRHYYTIKFPIHSETKPLYLAGFTMDITARRRAEVAQQRLQARLSQAVEMAHLGYWEYDVAGNFFTFDDAFYKIFRTTADQVGGYTMTSKAYADQFMHPDDRFILTEENRKAIETDDPAFNRQLEHRIRYADGTVGWISVRFFIVKDEHGRTIKTFGVNQDITERKQTEEKLRMMAEMLDNAPNAITVHDDKGRFLYANRKSFSLHGYDENEFMATNLHDLDVPESKALKDDRYRLIEEKGEALFEVVHYRKDKTTVPLEIYAKKVVWAGIPTILSIATDISERKQAEKEHDSLQSQLIQSQKMEAVGRLAGGVAHDFNNMLSVITGYAEIAQSKVTPDDPLYADLREIHTAGRRSADLTRQLLAFARRQTIAPKTLDLNDTVEGMLKMLRRLIGEDIDLSWQPGPGLWPVMMDPAQLDQVLANLCVNARDAISGVGKITIETENVRFDQAYCRDHDGFMPGEYVRLAVSDNGCGMSKEVLDKLFEPFFTTKGVGQGTGLGLATVYGIVKQNSGFINVYSEPDKGSTFKIYLPRRSEGAVEIREAGGMQAPAGRGETVLIVEDEASILKLGKKILEGLSYNVLTAGTPAEALSLAQQHGGRIDLLITDVVMPEMNGRDLAERLKGHYPDLKVLFMSGYTANVIAHHGVLDEGVDFIPKPFSRQEMAAKVRQALDI